MTCDSQKSERDLSVQLYGWNKLNAHIKGTVPQILCMAMFTVVYVN